MSTVVPGGEPPEPSPGEAPVYAVVPRMLLGSQLLRLREAVGITPDQVGFEIRGSRSKISRLEAGRAKFKIRHERHQG